MNNKTFGLIAVLALTAAGAALATTLRTEQTCESMTAPPAAAGPHHTLAVEVAGNTPAWAEEVRAFVAEQLAASGDADPQLPLTVRVVLVKDGQVQRPATACLRSQLVLKPADQDAHAYEEGSASTKETMLANMAERRQAEVTAVADALAAEVAATSFAKEGPDGVRLTYLSVWSAAVEADDAPPDRRWIGVLSPLHSNAGDCLDPTSGTKPATPADLVRDCVAAGQLPRADASHVAVEWVRAVAAAAPQRAAATAAADALCSFAATAGCAPRTAA